MVIGIHTRAAAWLLFVAVCITNAQADNSKPYIFRGVEPGATTVEALRANERWGAPRKEQREDDGTLRWSYEPQGYKQAIITIRGGRVQTIDVKLPDGITVDDAALALKLGNPAIGNKLSEAAQVGIVMPKEWRPVAYTAGRALLFVDPKSNQARALRSYAATVMNASAGSPAAVTVRPNASPGADSTGSTPNAARGPTTTTREVMVGLARVFPQQHISGHPVDDEIARRMMGLFIDQLDANRHFLMRDDVEQARRGYDALADQLRRGDLTWVNNTFRLFLQRVEERRALVEKLFTSDHDFNVDEQFDLTGWKDNWAENDLEMRETWRKRVKYQILLHLQAGATDEEARARAARDLRDIFDRWRKFSDDELLATAAEAFALAFDARSGYYTARAWEDSMTALAAQLVGIGASLQINGGYTEIVKVISGGPAAEDGRLKEGDRIVAVAQGDEAFADIVGMKLSDVVDRIRGKEGTKVRLRALPKGGFEGKVIELTRRRFTIQNIGSAVLTTDVGGKPSDAKIGYIYLPTLYTDLAGQKAGLKDYRSTARDLVKILADLRAKDVEVAVLDMRDNTGGTLTESIEVAGLLVGEEPVVLVRDSQGRVTDYKPQNKPTVWDRPLIVLTNKSSSGGIEIIAAAVQDHRRGIIVGDSVTNGNGVIGTQDPLATTLYGPPASSSTEKPERLGVTRITTQKFYRATGGGIQIKGVTADIILPSLTEGSGSTQGDSPYALSFDSEKGVEIKPAKVSLDDEAIKRIAAASVERRVKSGYFKKLTERMGRLGELKKNNVVSLNKEKFLAERRETAGFDADAAAVPGVPDVKLTPYLQEVFAIALDFASQLDIARGEAALKERRYADALADLRRAVVAGPNSKSARYKLAWSLATIPDKQFRNGKQAVEHAQRLCELDGRNNWMYVLALAVAQAEAGDFQQAQVELDAALKKAPEADRKPYEKLRERFKNKRTFAG